MANDRVNLAPLEGALRTLIDAHAAPPLEAFSPKAVIRELGAQGWIDSVETWFLFLEARNQTSHMYKQDIATSVFDVSKRFPDECTKLLEKMRAL